jgi:hypothetical protein
VKAKWRVQEAEWILFNPEWRLVEAEWKLQVMEDGETEQRPLNKE